MALGFAFNGQHSSSDFGIVVKSINRSMLPGMIKKEISIPGRHGTYDFSDNVYENRVISIGISYKASSYNDLREKVRDLAVWLSQQTYKELIFDDEPDKYYLAKVYPSVSFENMMKLGKTMIEFTCQPHALSIETTATDIILDSDTPLDSDIILDSGDDYIINILPEESEKTQNIYHYGNSIIGSSSEILAKFDIIITGTFTSFSITINGNTLTYTENCVSQTITIDNINMTCKNGTTNKLSNLTGYTTEFLFLEPGNNSVEINKTGGGEIDVTFDFNHYYI